MSTEAALAAIRREFRSSEGVFTGVQAIDEGVSRRQLNRLRAAAIVERLLPDVYVASHGPATPRQRLRAACLWGGPKSIVAALSAGNLYGCEGVDPIRPCIALPQGTGKRCDEVDVMHYRSREALMPRQWKGFTVAGIEATIVQLASAIDPESVEIAFEDARRRRLTTTAAMHSYLRLHAAKGRQGVGAMRALVRQFDPVHASRSTLEVKTRILLAASDLPRFTREHPLVWEGRTYWFDFAREAQRLVLETNGRRWHDDPTDYEYNHEKWSVPGRLGWRIVFATWEKVTERPHDLIDELRVALAAP